MMLRDIQFKSFRKRKSQIIGDVTKLKSISIDAVNALSCWYSSSKFQYIEAIVLLLKKAVGLVTDIKNKLVRKLIWSKSDEEKLRWLHEQVIEVNASIVKVFLLRKLSHGIHGMGWDESGGSMGRFFRPIPSHSEPWFLIKWSVLCLRSSISIFTCHCQLLFSIYVYRQDNDNHTCNK